MKIEKVNDNQIKCTLTSEDLKRRKLKLSELAYGSEKAKGLFRDMMKQASSEFGFEAENMPLMIEAIPIDQDCIVLIVTKVEDPDEIDTRFSKFAPGIEDDEDVSEDDSFDDSSVDSLPFSAEEALELFNKIKEAKASAVADGEKQTPSKIVKRASLLIKNSSLSDFCGFARIANTFYQDNNSLYKEDRSGQYYMLLSTALTSEKDFARLLNLAMEYGKVEKSKASRLAYLTEHMSCIICNDAIEKLSSL